MPIDHLANEILSQVFVHWQNLERYRASPQAFLRPHPGMLVNKHWNTLINSTPALWSIVVVVLPEAPMMYNLTPGYWDRALQHAHRCFSASAALPLTLVIASILEDDTPNDYDAFKPINQRHMAHVRRLLIDNASRIDTLVFRCLFNVSDHLLRYIEEQKMEFSILRRCFFQTGLAYSDTLYGDENGPTLWRFWEAPKLQRLSAALNMQAASFKLPRYLPSLRKIELTGRMSHSRFVDFLGRTPQLEGALVTVAAPTFSERLEKPILHTYSNQLANLVTLGLIWRAGQVDMMDLPAMPALRHVYLNTYGSPMLGMAESGQREELGRISVFLKNHSSLLRTLIIYLDFTDVVYGDGEELEILPHLPNVECLAFWSRSMLGSLGIWKHLLKMEAKREPSQPLLLPRASTFRHIWPHWFVAKELEEFVRSNAFRQWIASRAFDKIKLLFGSVPSNLETRKYQQSFVDRFSPENSLPWVDLHFLPQDAFTTGVKTDFNDGEGLSLIENAAVPSFRPESWY